MAQRLGLQSGALEQVMSLLGHSLTPRQYQFTTPRQPGFLENLAVGAAPGIGAAFPGAVRGQRLEKIGMIPQVALASALFTEQLDTFQDPFFFK